METKKENKKGFWATLFSQKPCKCSCGSNLIVEEVEETAAASCCCGDNETPKPGIKEIIVLGPGCAKCKTSYRTIEKVIAENSLDVKLTKIEDIVEIMKYNVMSTPAIVVDGCVRTKGRVPTEDEIKEMFGV